MNDQTKEMPQDLQDDPSAAARKHVSALKDVLVAWGNRHGSDWDAKGLRLANIISQVTHIQVTIEDEV